MKMTHLKHIFPGNELTVEGRGVHLLQHSHQNQNEWRWEEKSDGERDNQFPQIDCGPVWQNFAGELNERFCMKRDLTICVSSWNRGSLCTDMKNLLRILWLWSKSDMLKKVKWLCRMLWQNHINIWTRTSYCPEKHLTHVQILTFNSRKHRLIQGSNNLKILNSQSAPILY